MRLIEIACSLVTYDRDWHAFELVGYVLLGVFGGVYGALFCKVSFYLPPLRLRDRFLTPSLLLTYKGQYLVSHMRCYISRTSLV